MMAADDDAAMHALRGGDETGVPSPERHAEDGVMAHPDLPHLASDRPGRPQRPLGVCMNRGRLVSSVLVQ